MKKYLRHNASLILCISILVVLMVSVRVIVTPLSPTSFHQIVHPSTLQTSVYLPVDFTRIFLKTDKKSLSNPKQYHVRRVLSGVQPSGSIHLGNYLGAIRHWVRFQDSDFDKKFLNEEEKKTNTENFFCVADLHAITSPHDPQILRENTLKSAALYLAAGIDPFKSKIFVQSHVSAHSELSWLLNCVTPINWLERMIQFKDKKDIMSEKLVGVGLFTYPVLMAADILLYQADFVPVGEDQLQHIELTRDIVRRFNHQYCNGSAFKTRCEIAGIPSLPTFNEPKALLVNDGGARIMSLIDGTSKMSKSDPNDYSRINILDQPDLIHDKIKRCKTDSINGIEWDNPERPEATNLLNIYASIQPELGRTDITEEVKNLRWGEFKHRLSHAIVQYLEPIQSRYNDIWKRQDYLLWVLKEGARTANNVASNTLKSSRVAMGLTYNN